MRQKRLDEIALDLSQQALNRIERIEAEQRLQSAALSLTMRLMTRIDERLTILEERWNRRDTAKKRR